MAENEEDPVAESEVPQETVPEEEERSPIPPLEEQAVEKSPESEPPALEQVEKEEKPEEPVESSRIEPVEPEETSEPVESENLIELVGHSRTIFSPGLRSVGQFFQKYCPTGHK